MACQPVRQRQLLAAAAKEVDGAVRRLFALLVPYTRVALRVIDTQRDAVLLHLPQVGGWHVLAHGRYE